MKFLLLTYDPQGTDGPDVVPFADEASAFAELKRAAHAKQPREEVVLFHTDSIETLKADALPLLLQRERDRRTDVQDG